MLAEVAAAAGLEPDAVPTAIDGCGVLTFALELRRAAAMFGLLRVA
jgi:L-asparaginase II